MSTAAVVGIHRQHRYTVVIRHFVKELLHPTAKTVEGLLGIPYIKEASKLTLPHTCKYFIDERFKQQKLQCRSILKLIEQNMLELRIELEIQELFGDTLIEQPVGEIGQIIKGQYPRLLGMGDRCVLVVIIEGKEIVQDDTLSGFHPLSQQLLQRQKCFIDLRVCLYILFIIAMVSKALFGKDRFGCQCFDVRWLKVGNG